MTDKSEAEKAAEEYANSYGHGPYIPPRFLEDVRDLLRDELKLAHLAGQHAGRKRMIEEAKGCSFDHNASVKLYGDASPLPEYLVIGISDLEKLEEEK